MFKAESQRASVLLFSDIDKRLSESNFIVATSE